MIEFPLPDLLDKVAILKLKTERIDKEYLGNAQEAYDFYMQEIRKNYACKDFIEKALKDLYKINGKIWDNEHLLRSGSLCKLPLAEIGRRTMKIRDLNKIRLTIKERIVDETKSGFKDIRVSLYG